MKKRKNGAMHTILGNKIDYDTYKTSKQVTKVMYEKNLTKFNFLEDNRDIIEAKVDSLVESIRRKGQLIPIIVNENFDVIEGQHRVKACEKLGLPVSYVISIGATSKDIADINNSQSGWKNKDFLKHFSHKNHSNYAEYRKMQNFFEEYKLPFTVGIALLSNKTILGGCGNDRGPMPSFRDGTFKIIDLDKAKETASRLIKLKSFVPNLVKIVKFSIAFIKISGLENFDLKTCYTQLEKNSNKFDRCLNQEDWNEAMVRAYNFSLVTKATKNKKAGKRISIRKEGF